VPPAKTAARPKKAPAERKAPAGAKKAAAPRRAGAAASRTTLAEVMAALEKAGTAQARKTYARHGATGPMFGVSFATLGAMVKRIGVDQELALALWDTGNFDARNLAMKIADPATISPEDLDRWAREIPSRMSCLYVCMIAQEGPRGLSTATRWLASSDDRVRAVGWGLVGQLAGRDEATPESWFADRLSEIERTLRTSSNDVRYAMNNALIQIGGRSPALKKAALAAAKRIGPVEVDHGDTECKTPDAAATVEKMWAHAKAKGYDTPTAQERHRKPPRNRC
jgi:3-methyladenine DNA glycosylase AlkD